LVGVLQILFDGQRAAGVAFQHEGQQRVVEATSEVIVAAGTVGTTKLLLLSGIGPREHLQSLKVGQAGFIATISPASTRDISSSDDDFF